MKYLVRIAPSALKDIENIYQWLKADAPHRADSWFKGLFEVVDSLQTMPLRCPIAPESEIVDQEIRCLLYKKRYRILYQVENQIVRIYHIRHSSQERISRERL